MLGKPDTFNILFVMISRDQIDDVKVTRLNIW